MYLESWMRCAGVQQCAVFEVDEVGVGQVEEVVHEVAEDVRAEAEAWPDWCNACRRHRERSVEGRHVRGDVGAVDAAVGVW